MSDRKFMGFGGDAPKFSVLRKIIVGVVCLGWLGMTVPWAAMLIVWLGDPYPANAVRQRPVGVDEPLIEVATRTPGDTFVVFYTGDNGWRQGDRGFVAHLAERGYPTVAIDSLKYFSRSPSRAQAAEDLSRTIQHYSQVWRRPRVVLAGYSFGAEALLQIAPGLSAAARSRVRGVALIAPGPKSDLTLHPYTLLGLDDPTAPSTVELLKGIEGIPTTCIYALDDRSATCRRMRSRWIVLRPLSGGHRFKGQFDAVAREIAGTGTEAP